MKKTTKFILGALALGLVACSSDEPGNNNGSEATQGNLYTTLTLNFGTRSTTSGEGTSSDGVEVGTVSENNVNQVLVVVTLAEDDSYLTSSLADATYQSSTGSTNNSSNTNPIYVVRFETQNLLAKAGKEVNVYAYCNPTQALKDLYLDNTLSANKSVEPGFLDKVLTLSNGDIWESNYFLMSNSAKHTVTLPSENDMYNVYNKETNPFNLETVTVQRVAARFDFKDKVDNEVYNTFTISNPVTNTQVATVTFDGMALFNQAKDYYAFMHTSADGTNDKWVLCGKDAPTNYVVSPYFQKMLDTNNDYSWTNSSYNVALNNINVANLDFTELPLSKESPKYNYWKYTTPNTIPQAKTTSDVLKSSLQKKGYTSGVVFRAYLTANDENSNLAEAMEDGENVYTFDGILYSKADMLALVNNQPSSSLQKAFTNCFDVNNETVNEKDGADFTGNGFSVYKPVFDNGKYIYYCYYYYYNRHNDNGNAGVMGQMEFAVVRNNVYKLSITNVLTYGHPGDPDDDVDPEDPNDPDEEPETYFKVSVEVLPWVVRYNNIEF